MTERLEKGRLTNIVLDPIVLAHTGQRLLDADGLAKMVEKLIPLATIVTPNVIEAEIITGRKINDVEEMKEAAADIKVLGAEYVLLKAGHLNEADDVLFDGKNFLILSGRRIDAAAVHGTGCAMAAAIAAGLAQGRSVIQSVTRAKELVGRAIEGALTVGKGRKVANQSAFVLKSKRL